MKYTIEVDDSLNPGPESHEFEPGQSIPAFRKAVMVAALEILDKPNREITVKLIEGAHGLIERMATIKSESFTD